MPLRRAVLIAALTGAAVLLLTALPVSAHVERPAYFPDPAADAAVSPATGGGVPKIRSLASALNRKLPGTTRVVCRGDSLVVLRRAIRRARTSGYFVRPNDHRRMSVGQARRLLRINKRLMERCRYREIQRAVDRTRNNDRIVIMPGL